MAISPPATRPDATGGAPPQADGPGGVSGEDSRGELEEHAGDGPRPLAETFVTAALVTAAVVFTLTQLHPSLILANTTPSGGDMGAHVWGPDYLRRALLPQGRITGWAPDWYAGFPAYTFYFPLPALAIVGLDLLLPYGIAFKLVTVAGLLSLPVAAWLFGRMAGMRFPGPPLLALATLPFLFDRGFTIYGGNIASTLAGEFGFSLSLSLALVFLALVARGLETGRGRGLAAVVLALTGLCHLLPTIFAVVGALVLLVVRRPTWARTRFTAFALGVSALLAAFWSFPFLMRMPYANDMGWGKVTEYVTSLFPQNLRWLVALAAVGAVCSVARGVRLGIFLTLMAGIAGALFVLAPEARLWNARALPFWFLCLYLLAAVGVSEAGTALARGFSSDPGRPGLAARLATPLAAGLATWLFVGLPLGAIPSWVPVPATSDSSFVPGWARWNYSGYESKDAYPEYKELVETMGRVGRTRGCGRAHWEYEENLNRFGTPMALMLLPYWTQGCVGSMEGLYFESSATTPYHFLTAGEVSAAPSNPQRDLPYATDRPDLDTGVRHMQMLGTRYYMAFSDEAVEQADSHPELTQVATSGAWRIYEVAGSELVTGLDFEPAVVRGVSKGGDDWLGLAAQWFVDPELPDVHIAASGPERWARVGVRRVPTDSEVVGEDLIVASPPRRPLPPVSVSDVRSDDTSISFSVDRPGVPVLVKASYFPNWTVSGGRGPWRVTPNLMVVVPTENRVSLHYGWTPVEAIGHGMTLAGVGLVVVPPLVGRRRRRKGQPEEATADPGDGAGQSDSSQGDGAGQGDSAGQGGGADQTAGNAEADQTASRDPEPAVAGTDIQKRPVGEPGGHRQPDVPATPEAGH